MKPTRVRTLHFKAVSISRATGGAKAKPDNAVAACAYRSGLRLADERTQEIFDYRNRDKHGTIVARWVSAPDGKAPPWLDGKDERERWQELGNEVEKIENSHNRRALAELFKDFQAAAPRELTLEQNRELAETFQRKFHDKGLLVAVAFHENTASDGGKNPHFHFLVPLRPVTEEGFSKRKYRGLSGTWMVGKENPEFMQLRRDYYSCVNDALARAGVEGVYYDAEKQEGKEPELHVGKKGHATKGRAAEKAEELRERNREIALNNHIMAHVRRVDSPAWLEKQEEWENQRLQAKAARAARDVAQKAQPSVKRGRKAVDTAIDRALRSSSWREKEAARDRQKERVPDL